jgi:hypothetical protein
VRAPQSVPTNDRIIRELSRRVERLEKAVRKPRMSFRVRLMRDLCDAQERYRLANLAAAQAMRDGL